MMNLRGCLVLAALLSFSPHAHGGEVNLDASDSQALAKTQAMMSDQQAMESFAKTNPDALGALNQVKTLTQGDPAKQAELNNISSDIFAGMVKSTGGDSAAMSQALQNALKNPQAFMNSLTPEQQERIRQLASEMDRQNGQK